MSAPGRTTFPDQWLGPYLVEAGIADAAQLEAAAAASSGRRLWRAAQQ